MKLVNLTGLKSGAAAVKTFRMPRSYAIHAMRSAFCADVTSSGSAVPMYCATVGLDDCAPSGSVIAAVSAIRSLFRIELSPGVQVVELQDRVEHQEVAPDGLAAVHGIVAEQHDVSLVHRHVHHD